MAHEIVLKKLNCEFGVKGSLLDLIRNYLSGRQQFTLLNGRKSDLLPVSMGMPQGSVLGPTLLVLFSNDLLSSVPSGLFICMQMMQPYTVLEKQQIWRSIN